MRQGCKIIKIGDSTAIICGGEPNSHVCNENAVVYDTNDGYRHYFDNAVIAKDWHDKNYQSVIAGSVACSVCKRAAIDNTMWL